MVPMHHTLPGLAEAGEARCEDLGAGGEHGVRND